MNDVRCNHLIWLERDIPQFTAKPHWLMHDAKDGEPPDETVTDNLFFNYCPLCGASLKGNGG